jgi:serine/threonine protein phosphatase PrpC
MLALDAGRAGAFLSLDVFSEAGPGRANEDRAGSADAAGWVLDGTTGLSSRRLLPGASDAAWFVAAVDEALRRHLPMGLEVCATLRRSVLDVRERFAAAALQPADEELERPAASLALARRGPGGDLELASVGDCHILLRDARGKVEVFGSSPVSELDRQVVARLVELRAQGVEGYAEAWDHLVGVIRRNRTLANRDGGYWVLDLGERWLPHVERRVCVWRPGEPLLLVSDGFYRLVDTFGFYTDQELLEAAQEDGLAELGRQLRTAEGEDPECVRHPRIKVHDDATALLVRLEAI